MLAKYSRFIYIKLFNTLTKQYSSKSSQHSQNFITTPIFYVNSHPHIGHLYTAVLADTFWRWNILVNSHINNYKYQPIFLTGTDEHGQKILNAANKYNNCISKSDKKLSITNNQILILNDDSLNNYCELFSQKFKDLFKLSHINYTTYVRTTDERHQRVVEWLWNRIKKRGYIYPGNYNGWYSVSDEEFISPSEVVSEIPQDECGQRTGTCQSTGQGVVWVSEPNYIFALSRFGTELGSWLRRSSASSRDDYGEVVTPNPRHVLLSCSWRAYRATYPFPGHVTKFPGPSPSPIYVWFDALAAYLTGTGFDPEPDGPGPTAWPPTHQFIGKDILKFHAVIWPALLLAAGLELPRKLVCHSHWLVDHQKMSKSRGNVVDPFEATRAFGGSGDGIRYALMRESSLATDCNYDEKRLRALVNADLANTLGNLYSRAGSLAAKLTESGLGLDTGATPPPNANYVSAREFGEKLETIRSNFTDLPGQVKDFYDHCLFHRGLSLIMEALRAANEIYHSLQPWAPLIITPEDRGPVSVTDRGSLENAAELKIRLLATVHNGLRISAILLTPVIPILSKRLLSGLGVEPGDQTLEKAEVWIDGWPDARIPPYNALRNDVDEGSEEEIEKKAVGRAASKAVLYQRIV